MPEFLKKTLRIEAWTRADDSALDLIRKLAVGNRYRQIGALGGRWRAAR